MAGPPELRIRGYDLLEYLGNGACSTLWRVRSKKTGEERALKRIVHRRPEDLRGMAQAENEFCVASSVMICLSTLIRNLLKAIFHVMMLSFVPYRKNRSMKNDGILSRE